MKFIVNQDVKNIGIKVLGVEILNLDNKNISKEFLEYKNKSIAELLLKYNNYDLKSDEIIEGFYKLHEKVNVPRRKNLPASENLIKLLIKNNEMPSINKVVDIYNIISMKTKLCLGAHDIDKIDGNVTLKITDGTEKFIPLGSDEAKTLNPSEYSYADDSNEIICRLEIRQVNKTKITEDSANVFYIIQGNENTSWEYLKDTANELIEITTKFCGGNGNII